MKKEEFIVGTVDLGGSNLIEASAGTGKTFSIGILVLRLILEKEVDLRKILMVTFTKAAVAELEHRIRLFIREAQGYALKGAKCDGVISSIVDNAIDSNGKESVLVCLRKATLSLDDTSIFTIHGFCQKTLAEFAFETGQLFSSEVTDSSADITEKAVNEYWRQHITTLDKLQLQVLFEHSLSRSDMAGTVNKELGGKTFVYNKDLNIADAFADFFEKDYIKSATQKFEHSFSMSEERDVENFKSNRYALKTFGPLCDNAMAFCEALLEKHDKAYVEKCFPGLLDAAQTYEATIEESKQAALEIISAIYGDAIQKTQHFIDKRKSDLNVFTFDDLIQNLATAVANDESGMLKGELQKKYKCVFIDEFQDTDKMQYDIFNTLFNGNAILYYIGDPKQSIYGFRGADIDTYKYAASLVDHGYTMSNNFRSSPNMVKALNSFFTLAGNAFCDDKIAYEVVNSGKSFPEMELTDEAGNTDTVKNITLFKAKAKKDIYPAVASEIYSLLTFDYRVGEERLKPSDIAILVRTKGEAREMKMALSKKNIPSVSIDDSKVLQSEEAVIVNDVLRACTNPNKANINRALLNKFTAFGKDEILSLDDEKELQKFREINDTWQREGVYGALTLFMKLYKVGFNLLDSGRDGGERSITNLLQIIELLHKTEINKHLSDEELISWLQRMLNGAEASGDEFVQRIESDDDAVQIVTIHASKGLAYKIVFCPFLDLQSEPSRHHSFIEYKDPDTGNYCFSKFKTEREKELYGIQTEQENRRLIYVALTRVVQKIYMYSLDGRGSGSIKSFMQSDYGSPFIEYSDMEDLEGARYSHKKGKVIRKAKQFSSSVSTSWQMMSFSGLNQSHQTYAASDVKFKNKYDEFIFSKIGKGSVVGNFVHELLEKCDFSKDQFQKQINAIGMRYPSVYKRDHLEDYNQMMHEVLHANLSEDKPWSLHQVNRQKKIAELEFIFNIDHLSREQISALYDEVRLEGSYKLSGFMTGFVDLFFEHEGKYYILDWKSNFLGSNLSHYTHEQMEQAITDNNYHLQYLIYTIAVKRYLETRLPNFDFKRDFGGVYYIFLRGCRKDETTGVYFNKPASETIEKLDQLLK